MPTKPIKDGYITSDYGERVNPLNTSKNHFHHGIDISSKSVKPAVVCPLQGVIISAGKSPDFGNRVWIRLDSGFFMVLAHLESIDIKIFSGKQVKEGDNIGIMGNTGKSKAAHLHLEIRKNPALIGNSIKPIEIINLY